MNVLITMVLFSHKRIQSNEYTQKQNLPAVYQSILALKLKTILEQKTIRNQAGLVITKSDKLQFKLKGIIKDEQGYFILIK